MVENNLLFKGDNKNLETTGILGDWPIGRGAYIT